MSKIAVIGTGYVGLTTGACFSALGHDVICADIDEAKIDALSRGEVPILEAGLDQIVHEGIETGRLQFVLGAENAVRDCEFAYLCVPTPQSEDGAADLSYIQAAATEIAPHLLPEAIVVNKSTVPVGSTRVVERALGRDDIYVVSNPEFLREGSAVHDFMNPDRIVIGADDQSAAIKVASLYLGVTAPLVVTDPASAETIKYAANSFLATKISFINAIAAICEAVGADIGDVVLGIGYDKRIGHEFLRPGPGYGGSCFAGSESVLVRQGPRARLLRLEELWSEVGDEIPGDLEVLAWSSEQSEPTFHPVAALTRRPYRDDLVTVRTKMGRAVTVTEDHPFVVADGLAAGDLEVKSAADLADGDWLPVAQHAEPAENEVEIDVVALAERGGIAPAEIIVELSDSQLAEAMSRRGALPPNRRYDLPRTKCLRLSEVRELGVTEGAGRVKTARNGTSVPERIILDDDGWRLLGLYLAEGHVSVDGQRHRIAWSFHRENESDLVEFVTGYWRSRGVRCDDRLLTTTRQVSISSRILAVAFRELGLGWSCYEHRIPDEVWLAGVQAKRSLLRGLWDGDGSWSLVNGGPSIVFEYGTVSARLADGMLRLLGDLGIMARHKIGRSAKATTDAHFLVIAGTEQLETCYWLFPDVEAWEIADELSRVSKVISPTGYRRLHKHAAWVRVTGTDRGQREPYVYSLEVPGPHTVVTSGGLVVHNCFPKDTRAMVKIAENGGYDFDLLKGVIEVNEEQFGRTAQKAVDLVGGDIAGKTVGAWGLTFKARTDDMRESPALEVLRRLIDDGAKVRAYDPAVKSSPLEGIELAVDAYDACDGADVLMVLTEWDEFKWLDLDRVKALMTSPAVVDARNLLDRKGLRRRGFAYQGIGRN